MNNSGVSMIYVIKMVLGKDARYFLQEFSGNLNITETVEFVNNAKK